MLASTIANRDAVVVTDTLPRLAQEHCMLASATASRGAFATPSLPRPVQEHWYV